MIEKGINVDWGKADNFDLIISSSFSGLIDAQWENQVILLDAVLYEIFERLMDGCQYHK